MVRQRTLPDTYEAFDQGIAGYRAQDQFDLDELAGIELSTRQRKKIAEHLGVRLIGSMIEFDSATYGIHNEERQAAVREKIRSISE